MDIGNKLGLRVLIFDLLDGLLNPMYTLSKVGKDYFASSIKNLFTLKRSYAETLLLSLVGLLSACTTTHYFGVYPIHPSLVTETVATPVAPPQFYAHCGAGVLVKGRNQPLTHC